MYISTYIHAYVYLYTYMFIDVNASIDVRICLHFYMCARDMLRAGSIYVICHTRIYLYTHRFDKCQIYMYICMRMCQI